MSFLRLSTSRICPLLKTSMPNLANVLCTNSSWLLSDSAFMRTSQLGISSVVVEERGKFNNCMTSFNLYTNKISWGKKNQWNKIKAQHDLLFGKVLWLKGIALANLPQAKF